MPSGREELRRGVRSLIEEASREMEVLTGRPSRKDETVEKGGQTPPGSIPREESGRPDPGSQADDRPLLRLVRQAQEPPIGERKTPEQVLVEPIAVHAKKGVCAAYNVSHACWEVDEAYCNTALHLCMLRGCPVYDLHREEMERRFAARFSHLW